MIRVSCAASKICHSAKLVEVNRRVKGTAQIKITPATAAKTKRTMFITDEAMAKASVRFCFKCLAKTGIKAADSEPITRI